MSHGTPLTDQDRWDWLIVLRDAAMQRLNNSGSHGVVVTCSALRERYRDVIRIAHYNSPDVLVHFIYLHASEEVLLQRVGARQGHYMGANMVHSQLESLEKPSPGEKDVLSIDVSGTMAAVEAEALAMIRAAVKSELDAGTNT
jgi:gluconokinase